MDANGRLHMPGFVGETFEETGVLKEAVGQEGSTTNRHARRKMEALDRQAAKLSKALQQETTR